MGHDAAKAFVFDLINELVLDLNIGKNMSPEQVGRASEIILATFPTMKLAAIKKCFQYVLSGRFGKIYDRLDVQVICGWIREYQEIQFEEMEHELANRYHSEKLELAKNLSGILSIENSPIAKVLREVAAKTNPTPNPNETQPLTQSKPKANPTYSLDQEIFKQWDKLTMKDGALVRFVEVNGKQMDFEEFRKFKHEQLTSTTK